MSSLFQKMWLQGNVMPPKLWQWHPINCWCTWRQSRNKNISSFLNKEWCQNYIVLTFQRNVQEKHPSSQEHSRKTGRVLISTTTTPHLKRTLESLCYAYCAWFVYISLCCGKFMHSLIYSLHLHSDFGLDQGGLHCYFFLLFYPITITTLSVRLAWRKWLAQSHLMSFCGRR